jgi:hypothetical protein
MPCGSQAAPVSLSSRPEFLQVNCEVKLSHSGKSDVYITGYTTRQFLGYDSSDPEDEWATDSDEEPAELARQQLAMNGQPGGRSAAKVGTGC